MVVCSSVGVVVGRGHLLMDVAMVSRSFSVGVHVAGSFAGELVGVLRFVSLAPD
jgi:hypothetical protein